MNDSFPDSERASPWLVCPGHDRWLRAVRYFAAQMIPSDGAISVQGADPAEAHQHLTGRLRAVVLWEVSAQNLGTWCNWITKTAIETPHVLQLAATTDLSVAEQVILSELGIPTMIRHPEQLPRLANMIRTYFASATDS